jgi:hypothetical protein
VYAKICPSTSMIRVWGGVLRQACGDEIGASLAGFGRGWTLRGLDMKKSREKMAVGNKLFSSSGVGRAVEVTVEGFVGPEELPPVGIA